MQESEKNDKAGRWHVKDWGVLLVSLMLALFVWLLHNFSKDYSVYIPFQLSVTTNIDGYAPEATARETMVLRGRTSGFYIVQARFSSSRLFPLHAMIPPERFVKVAAADSSQGNIYRVNTSEIRKEVSEALENKVEIEFIETSSLTFEFTPQTHRKVPVIANLSLSFKEQYMQVGDIILEPDSITIYGNTSVINNIDYIQTKKLEFSNLDAPVRSVAMLAPVQGVRFSSDNVGYAIDVQRYFEARRTVTLTADNLPSGKSLFFLPSQVEVSYRAPFDSKQAQMGGEIVLSVDYNEFAKSRNAKVIPNLTHSDMTIFSYDLTPNQVECILMEGK